MSHATKEDAINRMLFKGLCGSLPDPKEQPVSMVYLETLKQHLLSWVNRIEETMKKPGVINEKT